MSQKTIDHLIINSTFDEPKKHWLYIRETQEFELREGKRKPCYIDLVRFDVEEVRDWYGETERFFDAIEKIIKEKIPPA